MRSDERNNLVFKVAPLKLFVKLFWFERDTKQVSLGKNMNYSDFTDGKYFLRN